MWKGGCEDEDGRDREVRPLAYPIIDSRGSMQNADASAPENRIFRASLSFGVDEISMN